MQPFKRAVFCVRKPSQAQKNCSLRAENIPCPSLHVSKNQPLLLIRHSLHPFPHSRACSKQVITQLLGLEERREWQECVTLGNSAGRCHLQTVSAPTPWQAWPEDSSKSKNKTHKPKGRKVSTTFSCNLPFSLDGGKIIKGGKKELIKS